MHLAVWDRLYFCKGAQGEVPKMRRRRRGRGEEWGSYSSNSGVWESVIRASPMRFGAELWLKINLVYFIFYRTFLKWSGPTVLDSSAT